MMWRLKGSWWIGPGGERLRAIAGGQDNGGFLSFLPSDYQVPDFGPLSEQDTFDFGQFDPGPMPFELPSVDLAPGLAGAEEAYPGASESPFAGGEESLAYDTTRGIVVDRVSGREISSFRPGGSVGPDITGQIRGLGGLRDTSGGGGILANTEKFLNTNLGRLAAAGGIGLLGLGAQRAIAGTPPRLQLPSYTPSALTQSREAAITAAERELAPGQRDIRNLALGLLPGQLTPGQEQPFADPIRQALQEEILSTLQGPGGVSPATGRRHQLEEQALRNRLYTQLGRDYDLSTEGIQALNDLKRRQNEEIYTERQATLARLTPLEQSRSQFAAAFPTEQLGAREAIRRANVSQTANLGTYGLPSINPDEGNLINLNLANQQALEAFRADVQSQRDLAAGIGGVFGTVAGAAGQRPSRLEELLASNYGASRRPSDFRFL